MKNFMKLRKMFEARYYKNVTAYSEKVNEGSEFEYRLTYFSGLRSRP